MANQIKVSKQFLEDFELIVNHYEFPQEDIDFLRNKARQHYTEVSASLAIIAANIRNGLV